MGRSSRCLEPRLARAGLRGPGRPHRRAARTDRPAAARSRRDRASPRPRCRCWRAATSSPSTSRTSRDSRNRSGSTGCRPPRSRPCPSSEDRAIWAYRVPSILGAMLAAAACAWGAAGLPGRRGRRSSPAPMLGAELPALDGGRHRGDGRGAVRGGDAGDGGFGAACTARRSRAGRRRGRRRRCSGSAWRCR